DSRKDFLPELMEHVRLPLISKQFLLEKVVDEPLLKCSPKCKDYIIEALQFHLQPSTVSQTIRSTPRYSIGFHKVILMLCWSHYKCSVKYWNDNIWKQAPKMSKCYENGRLSVINDQFVLAVGGANFGLNNQHVEMLDVSLKSSSWIPMMAMLVSRKYFGVGSLDKCVYAIGGRDRVNRVLNSVEVFDITNNKWQMVTSMSTKRYYHGVGVLKNLLYVVGGFDGKSYLNTVECYDPCLDTWTTVAAMSECHIECGVGVLDGVLYAIGGRNKSGDLKSVEAYTPSSGVWTTIADMHFSRYDFGVVVSNGLIHVIGGRNGKYVLNSIEIYNPKTNSWSLKILSKDVGHVYSGVVVNRPPHFKTFDD
ncbi:ring canal kelch isoform X2, partial [Aphis craccivora]